MTFQIVSRHTMFQRGAAAFVKGQGVDDHHMNPGAPAIADWQAGWRNAQLAYQRATTPQVDVCRTQLPQSERGAAEELSHPLFAMVRS